MTIYIRADHNDILVYPLPSGNIEFSPTIFQPASTLNEEEATIYGVYPVAEVPPPYFDPYKESLTEIDPVKIEGIWTQQWEVTPLTGEALTAAINKRKTDLLKETKITMESKLYAGFDYDFDDALAENPRGIHHIGTTPTDMAGWDEVSKFSSALIAIDDTTTTITIGTDTGIAVVTALEWQYILIAAAQHRQPIWARYLVLYSTVMSAADNDELDLIDIYSGWP